MNEANQAKQTNDPALYRRWRMVRAKLETARGHLENAGSVLERRRPGRLSVWVVRYRDRENEKRRYRAIYLGEETIAERARALIKKWRQQKKPPAQEMHGNTMRHLDVSAAALGFSRRARKRLRAAAENAAADPRAMARIVFGHPDPVMQCGRRPGRPSKSGLW